ncbi:MAG TPA: hypothetical protein VNZ66_00760 [Aeromicrobium sp.]|nr:hypothetical protein [Aeromicrobium sp.]
MTADDEIGSIGQEALRLLRALGSAGETTADESTQATAGTDPHACPNGWCPVCGVVAFVRDNPEAVQQVTDSAASLARALRELYDAAVNPKDHLT